MIPLKGWRAAHEKSSHRNHSSYKLWGNKQTSRRESVLIDWVFSWQWSSSRLTKSSLNWNRIKNDIFSKPNRIFVWLSVIWLLPQIVCNWIHFSNAGKKQYLEHFPCSALQNDFKHGPALQDHATLVGSLWLFLFFVSIKQSKHK